MLIESKDDEAEGEEDEYADGKSAAASAVMDAVSSGDASALATALSDFVSMCK
jgi:hypothetical protein